MIDETKQWAITTKWHQINAYYGTALCGTPLQARAVRHSSSDVLDDIRAHKTTVCGACERYADQLDARNRIKQQRKRHSKSTAAHAADHADRPTSTSIRTISGGLPSQGKRKP
ncbi:hypothetical protein I0Q12_12625 [Rhodococcus sp. CX]|uniref:hypothetical protein n=1 Tax=Rhodococcus sp. CX TaxID=2789880 RepID=UPI0018CCD96D|nr:hypothetical protein [Rhodococcus sp. CX]MBH0120312.1 hypothetical protein [Rhodococcus sp. CX]